jgi:hypothetical protein
MTCLPGFRGVGEHERFSRAGLQVECDYNVVICITDEQIVVGLRWLPAGRINVARHLVIVGCVHAHMTVLLRLAESTGKGCRVTVVSPDAHHYC